MKRTTIAATLAAALWAGTTLAGTYGWNTGNGTWDTTSANWSGAGTTWVDATGNDALFTNTATATAIAVSGSRSAGVVRIGNGSNNAKFTFTNGTLAASTIVVAAGNNGQDAGASTPTMFSNITVNTSGNIVVGHWTLAIGGSSIVNVGGVIGGSYSGIDGTWGYVTIRDRAVVTATGGVDGNNLAWSLNLNGGTLIAKSVRASDRESGGGVARLTFNGTTLKPTQDTNSFVTVGADVGATSSALVGNGGAIFDTDGKNIGIKINLKVSGSGGLTKLGAGTLTLSGTNTYSGATLVSNGTLKVSAVSLPTGTSVAVLEETAVLDLTGASQTVSNLSGMGTVSNGVLTVTGLVQPGGTNAVGTLTLPAGSSLTGKLLVDAAADGTSDVLAIQGGCNVASATLEVAASATLNTSTNYTLLTCTGTPARFASVSVPAGWTLRYEAGAVRLVPVSAVTYSWDTVSGAWDTTSENWLGAGTRWVDNGDAYFTNTAAATTITVDGPRLADTVKVGNNGNNAAFTFSDGPLTTYSFWVQGNPANSKYTAGIGVTALTGVTLTNTGNITVSSWTLAIGGSSTVNVGGVIGGANWGTLTIKDSAVVTVDNGVNGTAEAWTLNLNGGTLVTKSIRASDRETVGSEARITFNGTVVKPLEDINNFVTVGLNNLATSSALVGNGGAIFDTDGKNIGITIGLKQSGSGGLTKLGTGTLTLFATNHTYTGATTISNGSLVVYGGNTNGAVSIANSSFETYDGATLLPSGGPTAYRFAPTGASWTFSGQAGITTSNSYFMSIAARPDGNCAAFLYGAETFSQVVTVTNSGVYDLRFLVARSPSYSVCEGFAVKIDSTTIGSYAAGTFTDNVFNTFEIKDLALTAGPHTLLFQGLTPHVPPTYYATAIDRVTLTPSLGGSLPNGTAVNITAAGASFVQALSSLTIGSLAGVAGSIVSNSGVLTVGGGNTNTTFAGVISGAGSLVKAGTGTLTLGGANTYTGTTSVAVGTLEITAANTLPAGTAALEMATGAFVKLSNASEQQVAALTFNGVPQYRGTWGAFGSGAMHQRAQFTGAGVLRVLNGPVAPGTMLLLN